jgi:hypothetical protein
MQDYLLLSRIENGIFVYHSISDTTSYDKGVSYFVYHILKNNNMIDNDNVNLFIYDHDITKKTWELIIIQNKEKGDLEEFDKDNLESIFNEITNNVLKNNQTLVIAYNNDNYTIGYKPFILDNEDKIILDTIEYIAL